MKYPIAIETGNDTTAWGVVVPDLPGCFSAGDSLDEAYENAKEAIDLWINTALDNGEIIPMPKSLSDHRTNPEFEGWTWGVIEVKLEEYDDTIERINITMPKRVLKQIDNFAERKHVTRSAFLANAALEAIYENEHA